MKEKLRLAVAVFLILALLLAAFPAVASAIKTEVTGTFYFVGEPSDDPRGRDWSGGFEGFTAYHCRYDYQEYLFESDDPRLNGPALGLTNCEFHSNKDGSLAFAHLYGSATIYTDKSFTVPIWDCVSNGTLDSQWMGTWNLVCNGLGVNKGLLAKLTMTFPDENWNYAIQGYILTPGG